MTSPTPYTGQGVQQETASLPDPVEASEVLCARDKLVAFYRDLYRTSDEDEQIWLNRTFSQMLTSLARVEDQNAFKARNAALDLTIRLLSSVSDEKIFVHERPAWLSRQMLDLLQRDARAEFLDAVRTETSWLRSGPEFPFEVVLNDPDFMDWLCGHLQISPTQLRHHVGLSYLYYDRAGDCCPPHVDTPASHLINCLIGLEHELGEGQESVSVLEVIDSRQQHRVQIGEGDVVLFSSHCMPHARNRLVEGERISLLSIGFRLDG